MPVDPFFLYKNRLPYLFPQFSEKKKLKKGDREKLYIF